MQSNADIKQREIKSYLRFVVGQDSSLDRCSSNFDEVKLANSHDRTDGEIAASAANHLEWSTSVPNDKVDVTVRDGWITLAGKLESWYQKNAAENSALFLTGVKGLTNLITIKSKAAASEIEASIEKAFERTALLDSNKIKVKWFWGITD